MEIRLPQTNGWNAMHLIEKNWGKISVIVKRVWRVESDGSTTPISTPVNFQLTEDVSMESIDGDGVMMIIRETETALLKESVDVHFLGFGTEYRHPDGHRIDRAILSLNDQPRCIYLRQSSAGIDPINLFGYEPRSERVDASGSFNFNQDAASFFSSIRRSGDYQSFTSSLDLKNTQHFNVSVTYNLGHETEFEEILADCRVHIANLELSALVWEGGRNDPAHWCRQPSQVMRTDTLTLSGNSLSILWRSAIPLTDFSASDVRCIDIKEVF